MHSKIKIGATHRVAPTFIVLRLTSYFFLILLLFFPVLSFSAPLHGVFFPAPSLLFPSVPQPSVLPVLSPSPQEFVQASLPFSNSHNLFFWQRCDRRRRYWKFHFEALLPH